MEKKKMKTELIRTPINIYIFLFDGFSDWEISYVTPELQKSEFVNLKYVTVSSLEVISAGGLKISADVLLENLNIDEVSLLILPGGTVWENNLMPEVKEVVDQLVNKHKTVAAICGATAFLAQNGYLNEVKHTSNAIEYLKYISPSYKGETKYQSELAVINDNIITANGTAPIEFARIIFETINLYEAKKIENWFQLFKYGIWVEES